MLQPGESGQVLCDAAGNPPPKITWEIDGNQITFDEDGVQVEVDEDGLPVDRDGSQVSSNGTNEG